jgi:hypothetical protein
MDANHPNHAVQEGILRVAGIVAFPTVGEETADNTGVPRG